MTAYISLSYNCGSSQINLRCPISSRVCSSSVECEDHVLDTWFGNCVTEKRQHMADWEIKRICADQLHHWPGPCTIADLATIEKADLERFGK